jgi:ABC-type transport system involved in multi-copper enzyme maturation permease subunit
MTWVTWRQHRNQVYFGAAALAAFAVLMLITGLQLASKYHSALTSCAASKTCSNLGSTLTLGSQMESTLVTLTLVVPCLMGVFWGGPLVARELETGTSQFAWTQSTTRRRWLTVKAGWALLAAAVWGGAVSALVTWWSGPQNALSQQNFKPSQFDIQGIVPIGYALFAVALGITAGALFRRTLPALAVTIGVFTFLRIAIADFARPHYMTAITTLFNITHPVTPPGSYWQLASGITGPTGHIAAQPGLNIHGVPISAIPAACQAHPGLTVKALNQVTSCITAHGIRGYLTYQPANRYWAFQGIETGIFVLLGAILVTATAVALLRRDA